MMGWRRIVALLMAALCGQAMAGDPLAGLSEFAARNEIDRQAAALYAARDFDALDARSEAYIDGATRTSSGLWVAGLFASGVERVIAPTRTTDAAMWDQRELRVAEWLQRRPQSALAHGASVAAVTPAP